MLFELITILVTLGIGFLTYFKWSYKYWERKGVPNIKPSIPFGNVQNPFTRKLPSYLMYKSWYDYFKSKGYKHGGVYIGMVPVYIPVDLGLIKHVTTKDFAHFTDRGLYYDEKHDPLMANLLTIGGIKWKSLRAKITPTFTSGKMKSMFQTVLDCGELFQRHIDKISGNKEPFDIKEILAAFTIDVIGSCAFGLEPISFTDPYSKFTKYGRMFLTSSLQRKFRILCILIFPNLSKKLGIAMFERELTNFYFEVVKSMVKYREENRISRKDFMQILLELKNRPSGEDGNKQDIGGLTLEEIAAQAFVFFLAGFETSSTAMNFCLFELAQHQNIQDKVRAEIHDALNQHGGKLTYESIIELKYMGKVIDETLRKYPPAPTMVRQCVKDYKVPGTDVIVEKGTRVIMSILALHSDSEYYPDPKKFDPERFSDENKAKRPSFTFVPFGEGPRNCIGLRFGLMQTRVGLALILQNYRLKLSNKTKLPLTMDPNTFLMVPQNKIWLESERIN